MSTSVATLRSINIRLNSTSTEQLPQAVSHASGLLWNCKYLLSLPESSGKRDAEASTVAHHFKTRLSTLLQDRTVEGRWSGIVLVKAAIEAGGVETLSKSNAWIRGLLGILKKRNDPSTIRTLTIITLTRIFMLTWDYSNLVRELTTPSLPAFISNCLVCAENARCSDSELQTVLEAFKTLVPRHPTVFRTHESQIRSLIVRISSSSSSLTGSRPAHYSRTHQQLAQKLSVALHHCKPKQGASEQWESALKAAIGDIHETCDRLFRSVLEDWKSTTGVQRSATTQQVARGDLELPSNATPGSLPGWKGVYAGTERVVSLLGQLHAHMSSVTDGAVTVRIGAIMDMLSRLFSLTVPQAGRQEFVKPHHEISKDEREALYTQIPTIHNAALELILVILGRFGGAIVSVVPSLLNHIATVFAAEKCNISVRTATYSALHRILELVGPSLPKEDVTNFAPIIKACCSDLLPIDEPKEHPSLVNGITVKPSADSSASNHTAKPTAFPELKAAASALLRVALAKLNSKCIPKALRAHMDRTAVLAREKNALVASVLNPPTSASQGTVQPSLLPILARLFPHDAKVEALLRPRMPVIRTGRSKDADQEDETDGYEEEEQEAETAERDDDQYPSPDAETTQQAKSNLFNPIEVHTTAPIPQNNSSASTTSKRPADPSTSETSTSAKRLRASPVAETLLPQQAFDLPGPDPVTVSAGLPGTVAVEEQTVTMPPEPAESSKSSGAASSAAPTAAAAEMELDDSDLGSDFEMPTLTMGTDSEDEGEE
ncbi:hypothetical protein MBLNU230_g2726t1 [Neophaeotheca triangularis]